MKLFTVNAFTNQPFSGNPAGVCLLENPIQDVAMLKIARELNYSETAFAIQNNNSNDYTLRWFTPTQEVDLCGHATLATAKILFEKDKADKNKAISFQTRSGLLLAEQRGTKIALDFPAKKVSASASDEILNAFLGQEPLFVGVNDVWCLIELKDQVAVRSLKPDFELLKKHAGKIFIVTAPSNNTDYDFISRCFGPAVGINEDPVTGSAHCYLSTYWGEKLNKKKTIGFQASERTGVVECELLEENRVELLGESVIMSEILQNWKID